MMKDIIAGWVHEEATEEFEEITFQAECKIERGVPYQDVVANVERDCDIYFSFKCGKLSVERHNGVWRADFMAYNQRHIVLVRS